MLSFVFRSQSLEIVLASQEAMPWLLRGLMVGAPCATGCASWPGKPTDNASVETFNNRLRQDCLNASSFLGMEDARTRIIAWRNHCNETGLHSSLGNVTLSGLAAQLHETRKAA